MKRILMLLSNAFMPDPRPYQEALSLIRAGHEVKILCWDRGEKLPKRESMDRIKILRTFVPSRHGRGASQIIFLCVLWLKWIFYAVRDSFDIVYCHDFDTFPAGLILKLLKRKKLVFDSHEVYSKMLTNAPVFLKYFMESLEKYFIKFSDYVITTCPKMRELYKSYGAEKITVIGNLKNPKDFRIPEDIIEKEKMNLGIKNELVISYIANLGPERIIKPFLEVVKDDKELFLIIGGNGPQKALVEKAAVTCPNMRYLGYIRPDKIPLYTVLSDVIYYGYNKEYEMAEFNSPNKLFEALAAGRAFIGGDFGQMGEIIRKENCGIALDEFDTGSIKSALAVLKNRAKLKIYQNNARQAALRKYNWAEAEKRLLEVIGEL